MIWHRVHLIYNLADSLCPGFPGVEGTGGKVTLYAADANVPLCLQLVDQLLEVWFGHVKTKAGGESVVDREITAQPYLDRLVRIGFCQRDDPRTLAIVVDIHDTASKDDLPDGVHIFVWSVEVYFIGGYAQSFGDLVFHA